MKRSEITAELVRSLLNYNAETGLFTWRVYKGGGAPKIGEVAGHVRVGKKSGYLMIVIERVPCAAHRLAWLYVHGEWPRAEIDHINGVRADNRLANLREATRAMNNQNHRVSRNALGVMGVSQIRSKRYCASICINNKRQHIGVYDTAEEAHQAYLAVKRANHPGCTI